MDDLRFRWLKDSIYTILNVDEVDPAFEDFLEGDDGANELLIAKFLKKILVFSKIYTIFFSLLSLFLIYCDLRKHYKYKEKLISF